MPNINALIARGGGYQPPSFDYGALQERRAIQETRGLQNQLLQQQIEAQPEQQRLQQMRMQLQGDLLSLRERALALARKGDLKPITTQITAGGETYELSGPPESVAEVSGQFAQHIDHLDENAIPWAASQGVGVKKVEPKAPVMGSEAWMEAKTFEAGLTRGDKDPDFIKRRNELMKVYGIDSETATGIATGASKLSQNQLTGELSIVDMVSGTAKPVKQTGQRIGQEEAQRRDVPSLWDLSELATGAVSSAKSAWGATAGQIPGVPIAEQTEYARQRFGSAQNNLIRSLSINPRYPVAEMKRIKEEIKISPSFFDSPKSLRVRMRAIDDYLKGEIERNQMVAKDTGMPVNDRKASLQAINVIQHFLDNELGVPSGQPGLTEGDIPQYLRDQAGRPSPQEMPIVTTIEQYQALPTGTQYKDPEGNVRTKK